MARKLTPEELAEATADFPIPVKPSATSAKKAAPAPAPKTEKHAGGRPPKAGEPLRVCSFRLTERAYRKIKAYAASQGKTAGDLLIEFIDTLPDEIKL